MFTYFNGVFTYLNAEAATRGVLQKKVSLETSQNSQENTFCRDSFLIKSQALQLY